MEWPDELIKIFDDPLFANVHPAVPKQTADDRLKEGFMEICAWFEYNDRNVPRITSGDMTEFKLASRLKSIINDDARRESLRSLDKYNLLDIEM